jgi:hypothetical protein
MRGVKSKIENMGPRGSLLQAPAGGLGADFKTTPSWGGSAKDPLGPNASSASAAKRLVLPSGEVINVPDGLAAKVVRRFGVVYGVGDHEAVVKLVAQLLLRVSESSKGSVYYLNGRKLATVLGLRGYLNPFTASLIYGILSRLGFEITRTARGVVVKIDMKHPLIEELRGVESINEAIEVVKKYLGE